MPDRTLEPMIEELGTILAAARVQSSANMGEVVEGHFDEKSINAR